MRERQLRRLMAASYLVIVRVPKYQRKKLEKEGYLVTEYIDGKIIQLQVRGSGKQCAVLVRDGLGRDIWVAARNVLKLKGRGDQDGSRVHLKPAKRKRAKMPKREQMSLIQ